MKAILSPVARLFAPLAMFAALLSCESGNKSQALTQWTCGETTVNSPEIKVHRRGRLHKLHIAGTGTCRQ